MWTMASNVLLILFLAHVAIGQHTRNSSQEAIEALHRHHEIMSSDQHARHHIQAPRPENVDDYEDDSPYGAFGASPQDQLNRALADYLTREEDDEEIPARYSDPRFDIDGDLAGFEARKRSFFRERAETSPHKSAFRERAHIGAQSDLGQEFLDEMERQREEEEDLSYRQALRQLWDKYEQHENSIARQLLEERQGNGINEDYSDELGEVEEDEKRRRRKKSFDLDDRKKRFGYLPMYFGPMPAKRRRDYPLLPWLPNDDDARKKRFPVRKRSAKPLVDGPNASGTSDKVANDLQSLFGVPSADKKKRSTEETVSNKMAEHSIEKRSNQGIHDPDDDEDDDHEHDDVDSEDEHEHEHDHDHDHHDHDDDSSEEEDENDRKKKRAVSTKSTPEVVKDDQIIPGDLSDFKKKRGVSWDNYFGYDRRKKNGKYVSMIHAPVAEDEKRKKKDFGPDKLDTMDAKLKNIEDLIIEETVKYTGAHEGATSPQEIQKLKDHVVSRLATAYSLEKMRQALDQLRDDVDAERHLLHNEIKPPSSMKEKEVEVKKNNMIESAKNDEPEEDQRHSKDNSEPENNDSEEGEENDEKKKKRKRNGFDIRENSIPRECPLLDAIEKRCRGIDFINGDLHQELLPACYYHQLCYLCGSSKAKCDLQYLSDAETICGPNRNCELGTRSILMMLRSAPGPHLGARECSQNPCLYNAIQESSK